MSSAISPNTDQTARGPYRRPKKPTVRALETGGPVVLDNRTRAARAMKALRQRLLAQVGPRATPAQLALIEEIAQLKLRTTLMDQNFIESGGHMTMHDSHRYLAWSNSLIRGLAKLGLESGGAAETAPPSLADALAAGRAVAADSALRPATRVDHAPATGGRYSDAHGPP